MYGENDADEKFFTSIIKKLLSNTPKIQLTEGLQKRDFIYAKDVAKAYIAVINNIKVLEQYQEFEVGTGYSLTIKEFVQKLAKKTKSKSILNFGALASRNGDIDDSYANNVGLNKLGWSCEHNIDQNLNQIIKKEKHRLQYDYRF